MGDGSLGAHRDFPRLPPGITARLIAARLRCQFASDRGSFFSYSPEARSKLATATRGEWEQFGGIGLGGDLQRSREALQSGSAVLGLTLMTIAASVANFIFSANVSGAYTGPTGINARATITGAVSGTQLFLEMSRRQAESSLAAMSLLRKAEPGTVWSRRLGIDRRSKAPPTPQDHEKTYQRKIPNVKPKTTREYPVNASCIPLVRVK